MTPLLAALLSATLAGSSVLPIGGVFGNEDGCHLFMTGSFAGEPVLLTPYTFTSLETRCHFEALTSRNDGVAEIAVSCSDAGKDAGPLLVENRIDSGVFVEMPDAGLKWGPLPRCPGTEDMVGPEGAAA